MNNNLYEIAEEGNFAPEISNLLQDYISMPTNTQIYNTECSIRQNDQLPHGSGLVVY